VHLPVGSALPPVAADDRTVLRLRRSRRNLGLLALAVRRRLREERQRHQVEMGQLSRTQHERAPQLEQRAAQLAEAERNLTVDREILDKEYQLLQERIIRAEHELARRQAEVEADLQARWRQMQRLCQDAETAHVHQVQQSAVAAETRRLDLRRDELAHYARHLRRTGQRLRRQQEDLTLQHRELERLRAQVSSRLDSTQRSNAPHALECDKLVAVP
jgi:hypothetical protein